MATNGVKVTFGGKQVYQVNHTLDLMGVREHARIDRFSRQTWVARCNRFLNPLGQSPCAGYLLMMRKDMEALETSASHTLRIEQPGLPTIECKRLLITHGQAVFNANDSRDMMYVVEIADRRWYGASGYYNLDFVSTAVDMFNIPAGVYPGDYYDDSTNSGTPYTWQEMLDEVWPAWLSTTAPTLPYTPHETPIGFDFRGSSPYEAVGIILSRIGCALRYVPSTGEYEVDRVGVLAGQSTAQDQLAEKYKKYLDDELHYFDPTIAMVPKGVAVNFHKRSTQPGSEDTYPLGTGQWMTNMIYTKYIDGTADNFGSGATVLDNTYASLWDDLPAEVDFSGTLTNSSDIDDRAQERCDKFYESLCRASTRYREGYAVALPFESSGICRGVLLATGENDDWYTERYNHPRWMLGVKDGEFEAVGNATTLNRPPILGPMLPVYPYETFIGRVEGEPDADGWQPVVERRINPETNEIIDGTSWQGRDINS